MDAFKQFLLSRSMQDLLGRAYLSGSSDAPVVDVAAFLRTVVSSTSRSTASSVAREVFGSVLNLFPPPAAKGEEARLSVAAEVSDGLWQAFKEAQGLRFETGGNDQFVGIRYVLFSIFTAVEGALAKEIENLFTMTGVDRAWAEETIARYCMQFHEPPESYEAWQTILNKRNLGPALDAWSGQIPSTAEMVSALARSPSIALLQPDDPWSLLTQDYSGAQLEAAAFADMIVAKDFRPPLAIGIFGDWGAGKSYFMRLLHEAVANNRVRYASDVQTGGISFCQRVVQIRFNAWHYAEANLWASLVDHIFTSLNQWTIATGTATEADKLFDQLTTARRLTIEAATKLVESRRLQQAAAKRLADAEETLRDKQAKVETDPRTFIDSAFQMVISNPGSREELTAAAQKLGLGDLANSAQSLKTATASLGRDLDRFVILKAGIVRQMATPLVIILVALGTLLLPPLVNWLLGGLDSYSQLSVSLAGLVAPIMAALGWATARTNDALNVINTYRAKFEKNIEELTKADREQVAARSRELANADAVVAEARRSLDLATQSANQAALDYNSETGGGRVLRFVRDRIANGEYAKHLTFVATVRKDFEELSRLLGQVEAPAREAENAHIAHEKRVTELLATAGSILEPEEREKLQATVAAPTEGPKAFERIVLYVDDLDRCQPQQVIAVLQAIHLLLTFPLFVVFVAVDVRWLRQALADQYPQLFVDSGTHGRATTNDYLEKIFQIPYWVRLFDAQVTRSLLAERIGPVDAGERSTTTDSTGSAILTETGTTSTSTNHSADGGMQLQTRPQTRRLALTPEERVSIDAIANVLDGLPRRTLRFINTYWIIKGGLDASEQVKLESGGYRALVSLLAIAIGLEDDYPSLVDALEARGNERKSVAQLLGSLALVGSKQELVKACTSATGSRTVASLRRYASLVARYSFHGGLGLGETPLREGNQADKLNSDHEQTQRKRQRDSHVRPI